ncbi:hypothetical protein PPERSA_03404 [Pseudocohnilembus persalinus]|uniref:Uncharacterized protein n=1 Tax=Pseudocohnilembus persalinus TaxID=266149 RepID=A0A0V0QBJ9_PSEPJ|nr:hypothetical protein PPERSA_03404 [Pseudocohnilembus persalinus]|eukprot:KRW99603.1 hypothetical protein PPERSA_03404 [Pseudocohnilembus persalinus]
MKKNIQLQPIVIPMNNEQDEYNLNENHVNKFNDESPNDSGTQNNDNNKKSSENFTNQQNKSESSLIDKNHYILLNKQQNQNPSKCKTINFIESEQKKPKHENIFVAKPLNEKQIAYFKKNKTMHLSVQNVVNNYSSSERNEKMEKSEQIDNSSTNSYCSNSYKLKPKIFYNKSIKLQKARPGTPRYQGTNYGFDKKKIKFRHIGYDTPFQPVYYADNFDEPDQGPFQQDQNLNFNHSQNKNWVIIHGLEQPKLIKAVCKQFVDVEDDLSHEQKEEMWNGWVADFVETHSNPTLNDIDSNQLYMVIKYLYFVKKNDSISIVVKHFSFVAGQNYLLTFLEDGKQEIDGEIINTTIDFEHYMEEIMNKIYKNDKKYCKSNVYFILFKLIDKIVECYQNTLRQFSAQVIDPLDNEVIENPTSKTLKRLHNARTEMLEIKYATKPMQNMIKRILKRQSFYNKDLQNNIPGFDLNLQNLQSQSQMGTLQENQIDNGLIKSNELKNQFKKKPSMQNKNQLQQQNSDSNGIIQSKTNKKSTYYNTQNENNDDSSIADSPMKQKNKW